MPDNNTNFLDRMGRETPQDPETLRMIEQVIKRWQFARHERYNFEVQWQESSLLLWPEWANTFFYGYDQWPGQKKTQFQVDSVGMLAVHRFASIVDSVMTPFNDPWSKVCAPKADRKQLMKSRRVREFYDTYNQTLWTERYSWQANFQPQNHRNLKVLGVFGNMNLYVDKLDMRTSDGIPGLRYRSVSPGEIYYLENHQGMVDSYFRAMRRTAREIWLEWPDTFPACLKPALDQGSQQKFWILQYVFPRADYVPGIMTERGKKFCSIYISMEGLVLLEHGGFRSFPLPHWRYTVAVDEKYGRGPAQMILPTLKGKNAIKTTWYKQGHRAGDPIYLIYDDDLDLKSHPGAYNYGGITKEGKVTVGVLPEGNFEINEKMMETEDKVIREPFLVDLFQLAWENPNASQKSAREVIEFLHDRGVLIAPEMGGGNSEYLGPLVHRELDVLSDLGLLPEMPPEIVEAGGRYELEYTNPFSRALRASKTVAFMRQVEMTAQVAQVTGEPEHFDIYDFDQQGQDAAEEAGFPVTWMADDKKLQAKRQARAQAKQQQQQIEAMPAQAAIIKAQAISDKAKAGQNIGGTLSGVPPQQMPQVPGNPQGTPGQPGIGGQPGLPGQPPPPNQAP